MQRGASLVCCARQALRCGAARRLFACCETQRCLVVLSLSSTSPSVRFMRSRAARRVGCRYVSTTNDAVLCANAFMSSGCSRLSSASFKRSRQRDSSVVRMSREPRMPRSAFVRMCELQGLMCSAPRRLCVQYVATTCSVARRLCVSKDTV